MLKTDFHLHAHEDWYDHYHITYTAKDLILLAEKKEFDVLALTFHNRVYFPNSLRSYAKKHGILLIPGAEVRIHGKDVLLANVTEKDILKLRDLEDLDKIKDHALITAPHPYFVLGPCLKGLLEKHIKRFHAIEFGHFYAKPVLSPFLRFIDGNRKAVKMAKKYKKPLLGTSDAHRKYDFGRTFSWVNADKDKDSILEAIKKRKVTVHSKPLPMHDFVRRALSLIMRERIIPYIKRIDNHMPDISEDPHYRRR
ncbi:PHP domain-containing protein [Candidatus Woesearchaeota archaeon]|nr:PHP domain-containing protein [Candidatus Woesearchaeota archaeon]